MLETLDAAAVRRWCGAGLAALRAHQHEIDELNVYPVPDGDTGTNLVLTLASAEQALSEPDSLALTSDAGRETLVGRMMRRMARGALLGARGNSGVIVSQILRGMADAFSTTVSVRGSELARALKTASEAAYAAVARPVEGTVLSVVAAAAEGAGRLKSDDLLAVAREAARSAAEALARTPQQLPILARAGVVDAGGRGLVVLLDALVESLGGSPDTPPARPAITAAPTSAPDPARQDVAPGLAGQGVAPELAGLSAGQGVALDFVGPSVGPDATFTYGPSAGPAVAPPDLGFGYEVQYLLDAEAEAVDRLRVTLDELGDSLVVVGAGEGDPPTWNVHVHVDDIGAALEAGVVAGRPHRITVTRLADQLHAHEPPPASSERGTVVVAAGEGLAELFAAEGAVVVGRNPSIAEMLAAIRSARAREVVLLPNDANTLAVAGTAAQEAASGGVRVSVVPTRSPVQALAALAVRDPRRRFDDEVIGMAEAAGACRYGEVTTAAREALTVAGWCRPGELIGLVDGEVNVIGGVLDEVCRRLLDRMLGGGGELVTLVLGADAPTDLEEALRGHLAQTWPFVELQCYAGGQPRYHLLVGVE
ncbi:DAK2 domain-containing protein [Winogradskya consettensis]|uniref:Dihydroxyacetone kinase n=1 Tax=Winogradskya consettensis TaxID=113560 RepID=A0A919VM54_9ACTN|nr:DAK2 domain-containing protein [Actinoplanes consettensis]GIM68619.1 dihydroxyacetone kinase [Actinoplanes consettensis]